MKLIGDQFLLVIVSGLFIFSLSKYSPESPSFILNADQLNLTDYSGSLSNAVSDAGYKIGQDIKFALDVASSELYDDKENKYKLESENSYLSSFELIFL